MRAVTSVDGARPARFHPRTDKPCAICGAVPQYDYLRHGRCKPCAIYYRAHGSERPYRADGRSERWRRMPACVANFLRERSARIAAGLRPLPVPPQIAPFLAPQSN